MDILSNTDIFKRLADNAFEFFHDSLAIFEDNPKHALIFFCTAIELTVKARLSLIDAMWILKEPSRQGKMRRGSGGIRTVDVETAIARIKMLAPNEGTEAFIIDTFGKLRRHRNQIIHFTFDLEKEREAVARDLLTGWYYVHRLFHESWEKYFSLYEKKIEAINSKLAELSGYFDHIYSLIKDKCEGCEKCECCRQRSFDGTWCRVCGYSVPTTKDDLEEVSSACCGECNGYETAKRTEYGFQCTACGRRYENASVVNCEYCHQAWIGLDDVPDYLTGCEHCDGRLAHVD